MSDTSKDRQLAAIIVADRDGVIREWNDAAERIFGYSAAEAIGRTLDLIVPEEERADHWRSYQRVMASNIINYSPDHILDVDGLRKDGSRVPLDALLRATYDEFRRITAVTALLREGGTHLR
jgi:PAS domain S-box-containing protein